MTPKRWIESGAFNRLHNLQAGLFSKACRTGEARWILPCLENFNAGELVDIPGVEVTTVAGPAGTLGAVSTDRVLFLRPDDEMRAAFRSR